MSKLSFTNRSPLQLTNSKCGYDWRNEFIVPIVQLYGGTYFTDDYLSINQPGNYNLNQPNNYSSQFKCLSGRVSSIKVQPGYVVQLVDYNGATIAFKDSVNNLGMFDWNDRMIAANVYNY